MATLKNSAFLNDNWTPEEDSILEELLIEYSYESKMFCYAQIALHLKDKCIRDVILRCRWQSENIKKRGIDPFFDIYVDKKEKLADSMPKLTRVAKNTNDLPNAQAIMPMDSNGEISNQAVGGSSENLLEQNANILDQILANFAAFKIEENINLLSQVQNNICNVLNSLNDAQEMTLMPPLPVKLNEELIKSILQKPSTFPNKS